MKYIQSPPYCVSVCLCTGCNLQCNFCGINSVQNKGSDKKHFMSVNTATKIARSISKAGWNCRIEFGAYGESTLNPQWIDIIKIFRSHNPKNQIMILTNGAGLIKDPTSTILEYFKAGGTKMGLEHYKHVNIFDKIKNKLNEESILNEGVTIRKYPEDNLGNPHLKDGKRCLIYVTDLTENTKGTHSTIINMAGAAGPINESKMDKRCAHPFRKIIFRSTGEVPICCNDWMGEFKISNIHEEPDIERIWLDKKFKAVRHFLYNGIRSEFRPCYGCDAVTYRNGLLPDGKGVVKLPVPSKAMKDLILETTRNGPSKKLTENTIEFVKSKLPEGHMKNSWKRTNKLK